MKNSQTLIGLTCICTFTNCINYVINVVGYLISLFLTVFYKTEQIVKEDVKQNCRSINILEKNSHGTRSLARL